MKTAFFLGLLCLSCNLFGHPHIAKSDEVEEGHKMRIQSRQVWIGDGEEILVEHEGRWKKVPAIYRDRKGLYVHRDSMAADEIYIAWSCFDCGTWNWSVQSLCRNCGQPR